MTGIYHDFYWYITRILCVLIHWGFVIKETMRLPPQVRTSMHRCIRRWGTARDPFQSMFYWAFIYDRYMSDICMPYHSAGRFLVCFSCTPLSGLPGLPSALVRFRPGLSTDSFGFGNWKATNSRLGPAKVTPQYIQILFKLHTVMGVQLSPFLFERAMTLFSSRTPLESDSELHIPG